MTNQQPDIEAIKARADAATPGPWWNETHVVHAKHPTRWTEENHACIHPAVCNFRLDDGQLTGIEQAMDDAEFIAHAREDIPTLLTIIAQQQEEIGRLRTALEPFVRYAQAFDDIPKKHIDLVAARMPYKGQLLDILVGDLHRAQEALLHPQAGQEGSEVKE